MRLPEKADYDYSYDQGDQEDEKMHHGHPGDLDGNRDRESRLDLDLRRKAQDMQNVYNMRSNDVVVQQPAGREHHGREHLKLKKREKIKS